jgi:hypothetical protein
MIIVLVFVMSYIIYVLLTRNSNHLKKNKKKHQFMVFLVICHQTVYR